VGFGGWAGCLDHGAIAGFGEEGDEAGEHGADQGDDGAQQFGVVTGIGDVVPQGADGGGATLDQMV
jgi:hypothetical protein